MVATVLYDHTAYLDIRELAQVGVHGDESMIDQLLVVVCPQHVAVLQHAWTQQHKPNYEHTIEVEYGKLYARFLSYVS